MTIGDIIYNDDFDFNANYAVYDVSDGTSWHEQKEPIFSTTKNGYHKPFDKILDMKVTYMTIDSSCLIIEAVRDVDDTTDTNCESETEDSYKIPQWALADFLVEELAFRVHDEEQYRTLIKCLEDCKTENVNTYDIKISGYLPEYPYYCVIQGQNSKSLNAFMDMSSLIKYCTINHNKNMSECALDFNSFTVSKYRILSGNPR